MIYHLLLVFFGLALLTFGAEGLVRAGASMALRMGVTPLVIGLTIVAFGTGSPELVVSTGAAIYGNSAIALGNIVGSNISNTCLILGVAAVIHPLKAKTEVVRREVPVMIVVTAGLWLMMFDGELGRFDGAILFTGSLVYTFMVYFVARREKIREKIHLSFSETVEKPSSSKWLDLAMLIGGLVLLVAGAKLLLDGAVGVARIFGISEVIIALTVIAVGTSLPELATSVIASVRGEPDLALGNAIGSNILNILCILGVAALIRPIPTGDIRIIDMSVLLGVAILLWALLGIRFLLDRIEGAILLAIYIVYVYTLIP